MVGQETSALRSLPMELGEPIQVCCQQWSRALLALRIALMAAILASVVYLRAMFLTDGSSLLTAVVLFGMAIGLTFMGFPKIRSTIDQWGDTAVATDAGVAYRHHGAWQTMRWDEIDRIIVSRERVGSVSVSGDDYGIGVLLSLIYMLLTGHRYIYKLVSTRGEEINVGGTLAGAQEFMNTAATKSYSFRRKRAQQAFDAGLQVDFGEVSINKVHGVRCGDQHFAWDNIASVERTSNGGAKNLKIKPMHGGLFRSATARECNVSNIDILVQLIDAMIGFRWKGVT